MVCRDSCVHFAKLAQLMERYDEMAQYMASVGSGCDELSTQERHLLSVAFKNVVARRRSAWRTIKAVEQKEASRGNAQQSGYASEYRKKLEQEIQQVCDTVIAFLESNLIPNASVGESKVFYMKMRADHLRYIAEFYKDDAKVKAVERAGASYAEAQALAEKELEVTHRLRLGLALNYSVFLYEVLQHPQEACKMARTACEDATAEFDSIPEATYSQSLLIVSLLRDNLRLWTSGQGEEQ